MDVHRWDPGRSRGTATVGLLHVAEEPVDFVLKTRHQAPGILSHHTVHGGFSFGVGNVTNPHRPSPARPHKNVRTPRINSRGRMVMKHGRSAWATLRNTKTQKPALAGTALQPRCAAGAYF